MSTSETILTRERIEEVLAETRDAPASLFLHAVAATALYWMDAYEWATAAPAADREKIAALRKALEKIAHSPHCAYDYDGDAPYIYALGIADGHRRAAATARRALAKSPTVADYTHDEAGSRL